MPVYKKTYRIESIRKKGWDYGSNAAYFVTICTKNRACYFGEIENAQMHLNPLGKSANQCWREIPNHFPFVILGKHVIMPDHVPNLKI